MKQLVSLPTGGRMNAGNINDLAYVLKSDGIQFYGVENMHDVGPFRYHKMNYHPVPARGA